MKNDTVPQKLANVEIKFKVDQTCTENAANDKVSLTKN